MSPLPNRPQTTDRVTFITQIVGNRTPIFRDPIACEMALATLRNVQVLHPFKMLGYCILPDHMHLMLRPLGKESVSTVMHSFKRAFTIEHKKRLGVNGTMHFWQKSFMDHVIRDVDDLNHHLDYIHLNPVRHGYVRGPGEWQLSSFAAWVERGAYNDDWGWPVEETLARIASVVE